ncbi:hypothetical protein ACBQ88_19340 [Citrobacter braakii]|uniref:hypothetical protein n=1 Tax=Citrobacter braakii TaxID=57706 RepID=UPI0035237E84
MLSNSDVGLVKIIVNMAIFLEFTSSDLLDPDCAVEAIEDLAIELQSLSREDRDNIIDIFNNLSKEYTGDKAEYVQNLPETLGIL